MQKKSRLLVFLHRSYGLSVSEAELALRAQTAASATPSGLTSDFLATWKGKKQETGELML
jgi:hypothetical protein